MKTTKQVQRDAKQLFRWCLVEGLLDENRVRQTVKQVIEARRRGSLPLLSRFQHLVKLECSRHMAAVASAASLPEDLRAGLVSNLERIYGPGLSMSFLLDPSLIGGMRIQVGSDVYDRSVRAALTWLQRNF
jgi:F-type H+-transporting ATPase subunit delta